jgi:hypothetical protein
MRFGEALVHGAPRRRTERAGNTTEAFPTFVAATVDDDPGTDGARIHIGGCERQQRREGQGHGERR